MKKFSVACATLCGLGRLPWAPGTWGSLAGLLIGLGLLKHTPVFPVLLAGLGVTFVLSSLACSSAARALGAPDPSAVVLDECWAMAAIVLLAPWQLMAQWSYVFLAFLLFRTFDVFKPPPLNELESLPGGWGIMADDLGAAGYTTGLLWLLGTLLH